MSGSKKETNKEKWLCLPKVQRGEYTDALHEFIECLKVGKTYT